MNILFFDTETTGTPADYNAPISDSENWPRLVQLSTIMADESGKILDAKNRIIKPDNFVIPQDAINIHGITQEMAMQGADIADVLREFQQDVEGADLLVGHNVSFDRKIMGAELLRYNLHDVLHGKPRICTMWSSIKYCNLPKANGKKGAKYPKLVELYAVLFYGETFDDHNAENDVKATADCFFELIRRKVITRDMIVKAFEHHA